MKFLVTMNMPSSSGREVHSIIAEHTSQNVVEFMTQLEQTGYIVVEEFFVDKDRNGGGAGYVKSNGEIALSYVHVGKVKLYEDAHLS
jgi:hypothetical protein